MEGGYNTAFTIQKLSDMQIKILKGNFLKKKHSNPPKKNNVLGIEKKIIEDEDNCEYKTFEELNLNNNFEIYFITRYTKEKKEDVKVKEEKQKYKDNGPKMDDKQYLIFNFQDKEYPLFVNKNLKLEDALLLFQKEYYSFIDFEIKMILCYGKNIFLEKDKSIEQLILEGQLKEDRPLILYKFDEDEDISEINYN